MIKNSTQKVQSVQSTSRINGTRLENNIFKLMLLKYYFKIMNHRLEVKNIFHNYSTKYINLTLVISCLPFALGLQNILISRFNSNITTEIIQKNFPGFGFPYNCLSWETFEHLNYKNFLLKQPINRIDLYSESIIFKPESQVHSIQNTTFIGKYLNNKTVEQKKVKPETFLIPSQNSQNLFTFLDQKNKKSIINLTNNNTPYTKTIKEIYLQDYFPKKLSSIYNNGIKSSSTFYEQKIAPSLLEDFISTNKSISSKSEKPNISKTADKVLYTKKNSKVLDLEETVTNLLYKKGVYLKDISTKVTQTESLNKLEIVKITNQSNFSNNFKTLNTNKNSTDNAKNTVLTNLASKLKSLNILPIKSTWYPISLGFNNIETDTNTNNILNADKDLIKLYHKTEITSDNISALLSKLKNSDIFFGTQLNKDITNINKLNIETLTNCYKFLSTKNLLQNQINLSPRLMSGYEYPDTKIDLVKNMLRAKKVHNFINSDHKFNKFTSHPTTLLDLASVNYNNTKLESSSNHIYPNKSLYSKNVAFKNPTDKKEGVILKSLVTKKPSLLEAYSNHYCKTTRVKNSLFLTKIYFPGNAISSNIYSLKNFKQTKELIPTSSTQISKFFIKNLELEENGYIFNQNLINNSTTSNNKSEIKLCQKLKKLNFHLTDSSSFIIKQKQKTKTYAFLQPNTTVANPLLENKFSTNNTKSNLELSPESASSAGDLIFNNQTRNLVRNLVLENPFLNHKNFFLGETTPGTVGDPLSETGVTKTNSSKNFNQSLFITEDSLGSDANSNQAFIESGFSDLNNFSTKGSNYLNNEKGSAQKPILGDNNIDKIIRNTDLSGYTADSPHKVGLRGGIMYQPLLKNAKSSASVPTKHKSIKYIEIPTQQNTNGQGINLVKEIELAPLEYLKTWQIPLINKQNSFFLLERLEPAIYKKLNNFIVNLSLPNNGRIKPGLLLNNKKQLQSPNKESNIITSSKLNKDEHNTAGTSNATNSKNINNKSQTTTGDPAVLSETTLKKGPDKQRAILPLIEIRYPSLGHSPKDNDLVRINNQQPPVLAPIDKKNYSIPTNKISDNLSTESNINTNTTLNSYYSVPSGVRGLQNNKEFKIPINLSTRSTLGNPSVYEVPASVSTLNFVNINPSSLQKVDYPSSFIQNLIQPGIRPYTMRDALPCEGTPYMLDKKVFIHTFPINKSRLSSFYRSFNQSNHFYSKTPSIYSIGEKNLKGTWYSIKNNKRYSRLVEKPYYEFWEPLTSFSWLIITQFFFVIISLKVLQNLYQDYGKELINYVLDLLSIFGDSVEASLDESFKQEFQEHQDKSGVRLYKKINKRFLNVAGIENILPECCEIVWFLRNYNFMKQNGLIYFLPINRRNKFIQESLNISTQVLTHERDSLLRNTPATLRNESKASSTLDAKPVSSKLKNLFGSLSLQSRRVSQQPLNWINFEKLLPKGILLVGPPGTGKTLLVQAIAGEANVPVLVQSLSLISQPGESNSGTEQLTSLFQRARTLSPCIVFIDEIDTLGLKRQNIIQNPLMLGSKVLDSLYPLASENSFNQKKTKSTFQSSSQLGGAMHHQEQRTGNNLNNNLTNKEFTDLNSQDSSVDEQETKSNDSNQLSTLIRLLIEMDGLNPLNGIIVFGATNRPEVLDPALSRPGRFDKTLTLNLPGKQKRVDILKLYVKKLGTKSPIEWNYLANRSIGLSAADLSSMVNQSCIQAVLQHNSHTLKTLEQGLEKISKSMTTSNIPSSVTSNKFKQVTNSKGDSKYSSLYFETLGSLPFKKQVNVYLEVSPLYKTLINNNLDTEYSNGIIRKTKTKTNPERFSARAVKGTPDSKYKKYLNRSLICLKTNRFMDGNNLPVALQLDQNQIKQSEKNATINKLNLLDSITKINETSDLVGDRSKALQGYSVPARMEHLVGDKIITQRSKSYFSSYSFSKYCFNKPDIHVDVRDIQKQKIKNTHTINSYCFIENLFLNKNKKILYEISLKNKKWPKIKSNSNFIKNQNETRFILREDHKLNSSISETNEIKLGDTSVNSLLQKETQNNVNRRVNSINLSKLTHKRLETYFEKSNKSTYLLFLEDNKNLLELSTNNTPLPLEKSNTNIFLQAGYYQGGKAIIERLLKNKNETVVNQNGKPQQHQETSYLNSNIADQKLGTDVLGNSSSVFDLFNQIEKNASTFNSTFGNEGKLSYEKQLIFLLAGKASENLFSTNKIHNLNISLNNRSSEANNAESIESDSSVFHPESINSKKISKQGSTLDANEVLQNNDRSTSAGDTVDTVQPSCTERPVSLISSFIEEFSHNYNQERFVTSGYIANSQGIQIYTDCNDHAPELINSEVKTTPEKQETPKIDTISKEASIRMSCNKISGSTKTLNSTLGLGDLNSANLLADKMVTKWFFYSKKILTRKTSMVTENSNNQELAKTSILPFFHKLTAEIEQEIGTTTNFKSKIYLKNYQALGNQPWWQLQVAKQVGNSETSYNDWYRLFLPDTEESSQNQEWTPPDQFYINQQTHLINKTLSWNDLEKFDRDFLYQMLLFNSLNHTFELLTVNRPLLDYFVDYLIRYEILRENTILSLFKSYFKNNKS
uniref:Cell division protein n=1 Tax=Neodangemannia microcystis TaxID=173495 RepID=A0A1W6EH68_9CHLO|nr:cell division protein [Neodangemannia microcystis]ARK14741.1 cell division protein [Neodangemannia microcystis]